MKHYEAKSEEAISLRRKVLETVRDIRDANDSDDLFYYSDTVRTFCQYQHESSRCMSESNFEAAFEMLGGERAKKSGWIDNSDYQLKVHISQPFLLLRLFQIEYSIEHHYPILDEGDFSVREMEAREETFKAYQSEFLSEIEIFLESEKINSKRYSKSNKIELARLAFEEDCSYRGMDEGWVNQESINQCVSDSYSEAYLKTNKLLKAIQKKRGAK